MNEKYHQEQANIHESHVRKLKKKQRWMAFTRLFLFLGILFLFFSIKPATIYFSVAGILLLITAFVLAIKQYILINNKINYHQKRHEIHSDEIEGCRFNFTSFDQGKEYENISHAFTFDLDIFGEGSLFQLLNRTCTISGRNTLSNWLQSPSAYIGDIRHQQDAIAELAGEPENLHDFQAKGLMFPENEEDKRRLLSWADTISTGYPSGALRVLSVLLPAATVVLGIMAALQIIHQIFPVMLILINLTIVGFRLTQTNKSQELLSQQNKVLQKYSVLFHSIEKQNPVSEQLTKLQQNFISTGTGSASVIIKKLAGITSLFDYRLNMIIGFLLNALILWDIQCVILVERWKRRYREFVHSWIDSLGTYDSLCSLARFSFNNPHYSFPTQSENELILEAVAMGHPLIPNTERVTNDIAIDRRGQFIIITGPNMAGKSTFLRAVGINLVLAKIGAPVCAAAFQFKNIELFTSMRTLDSLYKHESYFYAELKRLQMIVHMLRDGTELFILLDEILKGTNTADKQAGSMAFMKKLIGMKSCGIIATHDLELGKMEADLPGFIINKCFDVEMEDTRLLFDYKLKNGIAQRMNAMLLMEQMDIIG